MFTWGFTPGSYMAGFQPSEQRRIVAELDVLQAEVDALKRLQAETAVELDALLPALLPASPGLAATDDRAFKSEP